MAVPILRQVRGCGKLNLAGKATGYLVQSLVTRAGLSTGTDEASVVLLGLRVVDTELATLNGESGQLLHGLGGAIDIAEVSVGKAAGPAGSLVDGNADVEDVIEADEELVQLAVGSLVRDVTDVERRSGRALGTARRIVARWAFVAIRWVLGL